MCHSQNLRRPLSVPCPTQCDRWLVSWVFRTRYKQYETVQQIYSAAPELTKSPLIYGFLPSRFPMSTHVQRHNATIQFRVPNEPPSVIFGHILANKGPLGVQDFAVKHTSLDEVIS